MLILPFVRKKYITFKNNMLKDIFVKLKLFKHKIITLHMPCPTDITSVCVAL